MKVAGSYNNPFYAATPFAPHFRVAAGSKLPFVEGRARGVLALDNDAAVAIANRARAFGASARPRVITSPTSLLSGDEKETIAAFFANQILTRTSGISKFLQQEPTGGIGGSLLISYKKLGFFHRSAALLNSEADSLDAVIGQVVARIQSHYAKQLTEFDGLPCDLLMRFTAATTSEDAINALQEVFGLIHPQADVSRQNYSVAAERARCGDWAGALEAYENEGTHDNWFGEKEEELFHLARIFTDDAFLPREYQKMDEVFSDAPRLEVTLEKHGIQGMASQQAALAFSGMGSHPVTFFDLEPVELREIVRELRSPSVWPENVCAALGDFDGWKTQAGFDEREQEFDDGILALAQRWFPDFKPDNDCCFGTKARSEFCDLLCETIEELDPDLINWHGSVFIEELLPAHPVFSRHGLMKFKEMARDFMLRLLIMGWRPGDDIKDHHLEALLISKKQSAGDRGYLPVVSKPGKNGYRLVLNGHHRLATLILLVRNGYLPVAALGDIPVYTAAYDAEEIFLESLRRAKAEGISFVNGSDDKFGWEEALPYRGMDGLELPRPWGTWGEAFGEWDLIY